MKKLLLIAGLSLISISSFAQEEKTGIVSTDISLTTREVYRGVGLGYSPSVGAKVSYDLGVITLTSKGSAPVNVGLGYGPYLENGITYKHKNLSVSLSDMFFFIGDGATGNDYFNLGKDTRHLVNAEAKYTEKKWYGLVQATVYKAEADKNNGVYFEAGYKFNNTLALNAGYVTDASTMSFRTKGGFTGVGISATKETKIGKNFNPTFTTSLVVNPSSKNVVDAFGVSNTPVQMSLGLVF